MNFDIVCFDCDSTLSSIEGIDELALRAGVGESIAALTHQAMNGELALEAIYAKRLDLIQPDQADINWVAQRYLDTVVAGALSVITQLQQQGKTVHIISGGIRQAILPLAQYLGLAAEQVHAVDIYFKTDGAYDTFDTTSLLARAGGKAEICRQINPHNKALVLIGDGQTDLEAQQAGATVIGFGGVVSRPAVKAKANIFIEEASLHSLLSFIS